ncbi:MAG TPA: glycosyltransferase family 2 protein [Chryseolinea sp.]|nr:glycosyltransferase family 2 protein [Chryseolinea sp.]
MTEDTHLVSVIIPCFNYGHLLHETLESVLAQTYKKWECIIVDDGSVDNTQQVAKKYLDLDSRFRYIHQKNMGLAGARNTGLKLASGLFIQLLDADDILTATKIERHVGVLETRPDVDLVYGSVFAFDRHLSLLESSKQVLLQAPQSGSGHTIMLSLLENNMFLVHCALFRTSILGDVGFFNEGMITCEDWNFWFRCAFSSKTFLFSDDNYSKVFVRNHGANMSGNRKNMWIGRVHFHKEVTKLLEGDKRGLADHSRIIKRNKQLLSIVNTRLELTYGNTIKGLASAVNRIWINGDFFETVRDSLYWMKERLLNRT